MRQRGERYEDRVRKDDVIAVGKFCQLQWINSFRLPGPCYLQIFIYLIELCGAQIWSFCMGSWKLFYWKLCIIAVAFSSFACGSPFLDVDSSNCITNNTWPYRLPWTVLPSHYNLFVQPDMVNYKTIIGNVLASWLSAHVLILTKKSYFRSRKYFGKCACTDKLYRGQYWQAKLYICETSLVRYVSPTFYEFLILFFNSLLRWKFISFVLDERWSAATDGDLVRVFAFLRRLPTRHRIHRTHQPEKCDR